MNITETATGIVLFAHGSRDPAWRVPLQAIAEQVQIQHGGPCRLAFLEFMQPDLPTALAELAAAGCQSLRVMPLFWAAGRHVNRDLTAIVASFAEQHPGLQLSIAKPLGDDTLVRAAIAQWAVRA